MKKVRKIQWIILVSLLIAGLVGCGLFDHNDSKEPTAPATDARLLSQETVDPLLVYQASNTPGITVTADLTPNHIAGQPYGNWALNATWREEDRNTIVEANVPVTVDANGQASALIPADFLDTVFQEAYDRYAANNGDTNVWFHTPGLYLNLYCDEQTLEYFNF